LVNSATISIISLNNTSEFVRQQPPPS
jgi:hypothetical protein